MSQSKTKTPKHPATVWVYQDNAGGFRWRFVANGNIMADSGEAYTRRNAAHRAWNRFAVYLGAAKVQVLDAPDGKTVPTV